jgi:hypothetical protein
MKNAARMLMVAVMMFPLLATAQMGKDAKLVTRVPFEFMAQNKALPAGDYTVLSASAAGTVVSIHNWDTKTSLFSIVNLDKPQDGTRVNALIFHKYGDRYFLSGMELASTGQIYSLPEGKAEAELRAQNVPASEEILLAALK